MPDIDPLSFAIASALTHRRRPQEGCPLAGGTSPYRSRQAISSQGGERGEQRSVPTIVKGHHLQPHRRSPIA